MLWSDALCAGSESLLQKSFQHSGIGAATRLCHGLADEEAEQSDLAAAVLADLGGIGSQHVIDDGLQRELVTDLAETTLFHDRYRMPAALDHFSKHFTR